MLASGSMRPCAKGNKGPVFEFGQKEEGDSTSVGKTAREVGWRLRRWGVLMERTQFFVGRWLVPVDFCEFRRFASIWSCVVTEALDFRIAGAVARNGERMREVVEGEGNGVHENA